MEIIFQKAIESFQGGKFSLARKLFEAVLIEDPDNSESLFTIAKIDLREYKLEDAEKNIRQAIGKDNRNIPYQIVLAEILYEQQEYDQLRKCCESILQKDENTTYAYNLLGLLALTKRDYNDALEKFFKAMKLESPNIHAMKNYALTLLRVGENILAEKYSRLILKLEPDNLEAKSTLGISLRCQGRLEEAKEIFYSIRELPKAQFNYGYIQLMQNNLSEGFENLQAWKKVAKPHQDLIKPEWNGSVSLDKTILLVSDQGYGDSILMSRFIPKLKNYFQKVIIHTDRPLIRLMKSIDENFEVIESLSGENYDYWCDVMDLPDKLGIKNAGQIPQDPWFNIKSDFIVGSDQLNVGINWAGNPAFIYDGIRSTHIETFGSLFDIEGVKWYSLHKGHLENEVQKYNLEIPLENAQDFYDSASVIKKMDLVISTCTAIPNLSASLDIPTCVVSNQDVDWRWDAWYKSAEVYVQKNENDWRDPVNEVRATLENLVGLKSESFIRQ
ncbi:MAG: hypothetical protein AB8D52_07710 [Gammaproteobacteria bacterium]